MIAILRTPWLASAVALGAATLLAGCASVLTPLGSDKYDCNRKENPDSKYCHSFAAVVKSTDGDAPMSRYDAPLSMRELDEINGMSPVPRTGGQTPTPIHREVSTRALEHVMDRARGAVAGTPPDGTPVREAPLVQRYWIKRHVDANDTQVGNTITYKEIRPSQWAGYPAPLTTKRGSTLPAEASEFFPHRREVPRPTPSAGAGQPAPQAGAQGAAAPVTRGAAIPAAGTEFTQPSSYSRSSGVDVENAPATSQERNGALPQ